MGGSAIAANHYLFNSTKQINPLVIKKLKGNGGQTGIAWPFGNSRDGQPSRRAHQGFALCRAAADRGC